MKELGSKVVNETRAERSPAEILLFELSITKRFLRNISSAIILCGFLIFICLIKNFTAQNLIVCVFAGVFACYLSNHSKLYQLINSIELDWNKACFFDEEMIFSMMRLSCVFFREVSIFLLIEPLFRYFMIQFGEESLFVTIVGCRWILFCLIFAKDVFYLAITWIMLSLQKSVFNDLKNEDISVQQTMLNELKHQANSFEIKEKNKDPRNKF